jgi:hypothetical protein
MGNAQVEGTENQAAGIVRDGITAEVVPQSQRNRRKLQSASAAAVVLNRFVAFFEG